MHEVWLVGGTKWEEKLLRRFDIGTAFQHRTRRASHCCEHMKIVSASEGGFWHKGWHTTINIRGVSIFQKVTQRPTRCGRQASFASTTPWKLVISQIHPVYCKELAEMYLNAVFRLSCYLKCFFWVVWPNEQARKKVYSACFKLPRDFRHKCRLADMSTRHTCQAPVGHLTQRVTQMTQEVTHSDKHPIVCVNRQRTFPHFEKKTKDPRRPSEARSGTPSKHEGIKMEWRKCGWRNRILRRKEQSLCNRVLFFSF